MRKQLYSFIFVLFSLSFLGGCGFKSAAPDASLHGQQAVNTAYSQVGRPYCYGGASPQQGFDCSGLVYWCYAKNGVKVPRRTTGQMRVGCPVDLDERKPGDILVFRIRGNNMHTGLYAGNNTFIHSPRKGKNVRKESLKSPYWEKRLVSIRRVTD